MEGIGQVAAPRTVASGVGFALGRGKSRRAKTIPARLAEAYQRPTSMLAPSDNPRTAELLRGLESIMMQGKSQPSSHEAAAGRSRGDQPPAGGEDSNPGFPASTSLAGSVEAAICAVHLSRSVAAEARLFGFVEAADFAGRVEEISRVVEYLQVVAAQAVERTRSQAQHGQASSAPGWQSGWTDTAEQPAAGPGSEAGSGVESGVGSGAGAGSGFGATAQSAESAAAAGFAAAGFAAAGSAPGVSARTTEGSGFGGSGRTAEGAGASGRPGTGAGASNPLDDGYRNAAEFLRARLRIGIGEARRRLALAPEILPQTGMAGQQIPARREVLAHAVETAQVPSRSATIISTALEKIRHLTDENTITNIERALTRTALESDPDFVMRMAKRWTDAIDQDGPEPSEEVLRQLQGVFLRKPRYGLHHLEIFATAEQYETLSTIMNTAANPRLNSTPNGNDHTEDNSNSEANSNSNARNNSNNNSNGVGCGTGGGTATTIGQENSGNSTGTGGNGAGQEEGRSTGGTHCTEGPDLDRRSRAQKLLDGLVGACRIALTTGNLPANGGLRPQVTVTIDHRDLLQHLQHVEHLEREGVLGGPGRFGSSGSPANPPLSSGTATFGGPIHPNTIRKIACDADIIPVLLGSESRILDIGRTTRIFPPHIRKAIAARDGGCAFPDCTMPVPWCEAHHITYWSHGGGTSTENGTLLCSHHHHVIHKEQWHINMKTGVPWFTPPPHIDPTQKPRRNHHHTPIRT
ncbi:DUF222 domain-containing protein [Paenarthrobacter sp. NPDC092416]|uniref:HNH endonuclease signature motif containing protein n=1 Tax=Paenarthrobacter sp. NPDC092416 TaxID=3364386 RepID=UPI003812389D